jgi:hypothetical protein
MDRRAKDLWVGVFKVRQQLAKAAGVLQKQPAHHCLKSRRLAIGGGIAAAGATAGPVATAPHQI